MDVRLVDEIDSRRRDWRVECLARTYKRDFQIPLFIAITMFAVLFAGSLLDNHSGIETLRAVFSVGLVALSLLGVLLRKTLGKLPDMLFKVDDEGLVFPVGVLLRWHHRYAVIPLEVVSDVDVWPDSGEWKICFLLKADLDPSFSPLFGGIGRHWRSPEIAVIDFQVGSRKHAERLQGQIKQLIARSSGA